MCRHHTVNLLRRPKTPCPLHLLVPQHNLFLLNGCLIRGRCRLFSRKPLFRGNGLWYRGLLPQGAASSRDDTLSAFCNLRRVEALLRLRDVGALGNLRLGATGRLRSFCSGAP